MQISNPRNYSILFRFCGYLVGLGLRVWASVGDTFTGNACYYPVLKIMQLQEAVRRVGLYDFLQKLTFIVARCVS